MESYIGSMTKSRIWLPSSPTTADSVSLEIRRIAETTMANVFISHRRNADKEAKHLAEDIASAGHQVWLDDWDLNLGDSIIERLNEGLEGAAYVVVCYSASGVMSPWMSREWMSALARQLEGNDVKILPVMLTGGQPPAILADVKYADLRKNWGQGVSELLRTIR